MIALGTRLGDLVRELRERRGWSMGQLAAYADTTTGYISKIEAGKIASPSAPILARIAKQLRVPAEQLLAASDGEESAPLPAVDAMDLLRQAMHRLETTPTFNLRDPDLDLKLKSVGGELTEDELDSIRPVVERALERKRLREQAGK